MEHAVQRPLRSLVSGCGTPQLHSDSHCGSVRASDCRICAGPLSSAHAACPSCSHLLRRGHRLYRHRAGDRTSARLPVHLWLSLSPTRHSDRPLHGRHGPRQLARNPPHHPRSSALLRNVGSHSVSTGALCSGSSCCSQPAGGDHLGDGCVGCRAAPPFP